MALFLSLHVICCDWCVKPTTDSEYCKALILFQIPCQHNLKLIQFALFGMCLILHTTPPQIQSTLEKVRNKRKYGGDIWGQRGGGRARGLSEYKIELWDVKLQTFVDQMGKNSHPDFPSVTDVDTPTDSVCHYNADIQPLNVSPSFLQPRMHLKSRRRSEVN